MKTVGEIANRLEAERDHAERRAFVVENADVITEILDEITWKRGIKTVMRMHITGIFKDADHDIDPEFAEMMAHMVRALNPQDIDESTKASEYDDYTY